MKLIKTLLLTCATLVSITANAQEGSPISCFWNVTSSTSLSRTDICVDSQNNTIATRDRTYNRKGTMLTCNLSTVAGVSNQGTCTSPSLYRDPPVGSLPVSCVWTVTSSAGGASGADIYDKCTEVNGNIAATRFRAIGVHRPNVCTLTLTPGITNIGSCDSPNLYRTAPTSCVNTGVFVGNGCVGQLAADPAFNSLYQQVCGNTCTTPKVISNGTTCPSGGKFVDVYCQ